jgi:hypothetical protein
MVPVLGRSAGSAIVVIYCGGWPKERGNINRWSTPYWWHAATGHGSRSKLQMNVYEMSGHVSQRASARFGVADTEFIRWASTLLPD